MVGPTLEVFHRLSGYGLADARLSSGVVGGNA